MMLPLGALLILLQGLAQFVRDVRALVTGRFATADDAQEFENEL